MLVQIDDRFRDSANIADTTNDTLPSRLYMPSVLPELWVHVLTTRVPKAHASMPLPYGLNGPQGFSQTLRCLVIGTDSLTPYLDQNLMTGYLDTNHLISQSDAAYWNSRLFNKAVLGSETWRYVDGEIPEDNYVRGELPTQLMINDPTYCPLTQDKLLLSSSLSLPHLWENGKRVFITAKRTVANQVSRAQQGNARLAFGTWVVGSLAPNNPNVAAEADGTDEYAAFLCQPASDAQAAPPIPANVVSQMANPTGVGLHDMEPVVNEAPANALPI